MVEHLYEALRGLPPGLIVAVLSATPVSELRGGIPVGLLSLGMPLSQVLAIAITANTLVVVPVVLFFRWAADWLADKPVVGRFVGWLIRRARQREAMVERYGPLALTLFVAVPLPITGAWTGAVVAAVFGIRFWKAMLCILLGVLIASVVVTAVTLGGSELARALLTAG